MNKANWQRKFIKWKHLRNYVVLANAEKKYLATHFQTSVPCFQTFNPNTKNYHFSFLFVEIVTKCPFVQYQTRLNLSKFQSDEYISDIKWHVLFFFFLLVKSFLSFDFSKFKFTLSNVTHLLFSYYFVGVLLIMLPCEGEEIHFFISLLNFHYDSRPLLFNIIQ